MANGGARPGAGRKPGTANTRTREIAERVIASGKTPMDILLGDMRYYDDLAQKAIAAAPKNISISDLTMKEYMIIKELKAIARDCAQQAAPYVHPKLSAVTQTGKDGGPIQHSLEVTFVSPKASK